MNTFHLRVPLCYQSCFETNHHACCVLHHTKHPFASHDLAAFWQRNKGGGRTRRLHVGLGAGSGGLGLTGTAHWGAGTEHVGSVRPCRPSLPTGNFPERCSLLSIPNVGEYQRFDKVLPWSGWYCDVVDDIHPLPQSSCRGSSPWRGGSGVWPTEGGGERGDSALQRRSNLCRPFEYWRTVLEVSFSSGMTCRCA